MATNSLSNVDVKIASKALVMRLANVSPETIQVDQYAYVNAVHTIDDIMEYTKIKQIPGRMVVLISKKPLTHQVAHFFSKP